MNRKLSLAKTSQLRIRAWSDDFPECYRGRAMRVTPQDLFSRAEVSSRLRRVLRLPPMRIVVAMAFLGPAIITFNLVFGRLIEEDFLILDGHGLRTTAQGKLCLNAVLAELLVCSP